MRPTLFLDMDGVLADFDKRATEVLGQSPRDFEARFGNRVFWTALEQVEDFFLSFDLMPDARTLYDRVKHLNPVALTGLPRTPTAKIHKESWLAANFPAMPIITCKSKEKSEHMRSVNDILIDDRTEYRHLWMKKGGHYIVHTDADTSIMALEALGIL